MYQAHYLDTDPATFVRHAMDKVRFVIEGGPETARARDSGCRLE